MVKSIEVPQTTFRTHRAQTDRGGRVVRRRPRTAVGDSSRPSPERSTSRVSFSLSSGSFGTSSYAAVAPRSTRPSWRLRQPFDRVLPSPLLPVVLEQHRVEDELFHGAPIVESHSLCAPVVRRRAPDPSVSPVPKRVRTRWLSSPPFVRRFRLVRRRSATTGFEPATLSLGS